MVGCAQLVVIATVMIKSYYEASYRLLRISTMYYPFIERNHTDHKYKVESSAAANGNTNFDCAINWVRIPKTASSSMHATYMKPTYLQVHTCLKIHASLSQVDAPHIGMMTILLLLLLLIIITIIILRHTYTLG